MHTVPLPEPLPAPLRLHETGDTEAIIRPITKGNLIKKIALLAKTAKGDRKDALTLMQRIVTSQIAEDDTERANVVYFDKIVNQIVRNERTLQTLGADISSAVVDKQTGTTTSVMVKGLSYALRETYGVRHPVTPTPGATPASTKNRAATRFS